MTREEGVAQVYEDGGHVVILGAGASIASSIRNPESGGKRLPSMDNFVEVVGLSDIIARIPEHLLDTHFEKLYGKLYEENPRSGLILEIEERIRRYFSDMRLPEAPTIYDYLVLSLRERDLIATFNWDPFLHQAWVRNAGFTLNLPHLSFLHGNVALGYGAEGKRSGPVNGDGLVPTGLLCPIGQKNYTDDGFIAGQWERVRHWMGRESGTVRATVFGYGAPVSDVEAVSLFNGAWGTPDDKAMEQFEVIDTAPENLLRQRWGGFIHAHHYDIENSYFNSSLANNPRRTSESYFSAHRPISPRQAFRSNNPVPQGFRTLEELWEWHRPLIEAERRKGRERGQPPTDGLLPLR